MDKSRWSYTKKKQYNDELTRRKNKKFSRQIRDRILDRVYCPDINSKCLDENSFFSMLGFNFPIHNVLSKLIQKNSSFDSRNELCLSHTYLFYSRKVFPGYYNDRERIIAILNRYKKNGDICEVLELAQYQEKRETYHYLYFIIGLICLDYYLEFQYDGFSAREKCIEEAIHYLEKSYAKFEGENARKAAKSIMTFAYYMDGRFENVEVLRVA